MRWFFDLNRYNDDDDSDIIGLTYKVNERKPKFQFFNIHTHKCAQNMKIKAKSVKQIIELI